MESTDLTCTKCGATWKLIKASADQILCPYCNAPVVIAATANPNEPKPAETAVSTPAQSIVNSEAVPPASAEPVPPPQEQSTPPAEGHSIPATVREFNVPDNLADDYDDGVDPRRRRGMNPVAKTILILLMLIILAPVALFIILFVVCVIAIAAR